MPASLKAIQEKLPPQAVKALELKYSPSPVFSKLPSVQISREATALLIRINTVTGWRLPDNPQILKALEYEFTEYLMESCANLKPDEIAYAIRTHGLTVKDWGKNLNLNLISECVNLYIQERREASDLEERIRQSETTYDKESGKWVTVSVKKVSDPSPVDWSKEWLKVVELAKNAKIGDAVIVVPIYDWLDTQGRIMYADENGELVPYSGADKYGIMEDCRQQHIRDMEHALGTIREPSHVILDKLRRIKSDNWKTDREFFSLMANEAKIRIVKEIAVMEAASGL